MNLEPASNENKRSANYQAMRNKMANSKNLTAIFTNPPDNLTPNQLAAIRTAIIETKKQTELKKSTLFQKYPNVLPSATKNALISASSIGASGGKRTHKKRRSKRRQTHRRRR